MPVGGGRCRQHDAHRRDRAGLGRGLRGPDTTVFRVEGSRLLQVFSAYLGIDTSTGRRPAALSARVPDLFVASRRQASRAASIAALSAGVRRWSLNVPYGVTNARVPNWKRRAADAERTGVHGVVPDRVEEPSQRCLCGRVFPRDRQGAYGRPRPLDGPTRRGARR